MFAVSTMSQGTCLLCFSVTSVMDIICTHLRNVYEEISDFEIKADSHPVCYICYTKLLQCEQLLKQIQKLKSENEPQVTPLVHLSMLKTDNWWLPNNYVEIEWYPDIRREDINEEGVMSNPHHCADETDIKIEYIKEEYVENNPGHYEYEIAVEPVEDKRIPTDRRTRKSNGKPHACDLCSKKFLYLSYLKRHRVVHDEVKPHSCDICNKTFTRTSTLKTHQLLHSAVKPYTCEYCSKKFTQIRQFKTHKLIHTNEKPYKCDFCNMKFTQFCNLKSHKQIHADEKPYSCDVCSKEFRHKGALERHKITHSGVKRYRCDVCRKKFSYNRSLTRHKRKHSGVH